MTPANISMAQKSTMETIHENDMLEELEKFKLLHAQAEQKILDMQKTHEDMYDMLQNVAKALNQMKTDDNFEQRPHLNTITFSNGLDMDTIILHDRLQSEKWRKHLLNGLTAEEESEATPTKCSKSKNAKCHIKKCKRAHIDQIRSVYKNKTYNTVVNSCSEVKIDMSAGNGTTVKPLFQPTDNRACRVFFLWEYVLIISMLTIFYGVMMFVRGGKK